MSGSTASASVKSTGARELVVSVNWIGDAIMAMPALQIYRERHPDHHLAVLARGFIADLWALHAAPDNVIRYDRRPSLFDPLFGTIRNEKFTRAWVLPNSFRSAWIVFRAGVPVRTGVPGGYRRILISDVRALNSPPDQWHQAWEYIRLMNPDAAIKTIPRPQIQLSDEAREKTFARLRTWNGPAVGMIPGAARGPSKRWPAGHFCDVAKRIVRDGFTVLLFGGPDDELLCRELADEIGGGVVNLAGKTKLIEWAALMESCRLIIANDSGGMHLAAALGRPVIALYGQTDPDRTGPLGDHCMILQNSAFRSRDISRNSAEAQKSLAAIHPETVYETFQSFLRSPTGHKTDFT